MSEKLITIKEVALNNNCPECYSIVKCSFALPLKDGSQLTFKQKFVETKFYKSVTQDIMQDITCKTCNTTIYPIIWTNDIERVFEYHKKAFISKKSSFKLKRLSWILIFSLSIILTVVLVAFFEAYN